MSNKCRLDTEDRKVTANMKQAGKTRDEIAQAIGFSQCTASKELSHTRLNLPSRKPTFRKALKQRCQIDLTYLASSPVAKSKLKKKLKTHLDSL